MNNIVTRLAPSPTSNFCHIGNLRTLLYNYFLAKRHGGKFLVRLEDTDRDRYTPEFLDYFKDTLDWLGIVPDASYWNPDPKLGSFIQSERNYADKLQYLDRNGFTYIAFDTKEELDNAHRLNKNFKYDSTTRMSMRNSLSMTKLEIEEAIDNPDIPMVVRFKVPSDLDISFTDAILGDISINSNQLDDKVLLKSNDIGSYHLCNVCDDHDMGVTHVLRGQEWIASTPFHVLLYKAFGWDVPTFAHLPLIMNPDGKGKLSKRTASKYGIPIAPIGYTDDNGIYQQGWKDLGYEPDAFMNALALVGWNPGHDKELMSMDEMISLFSLDRVHKSGARFDMKKATWINSQYIQNIATDTYLTGDLDLSNLNDGQRTSLISETKKRCDFRKDFAPIVNKLFTRESISISISKDRPHDNMVSDFEILTSLSLSLVDNGDWTLDGINSFISGYCTGDIKPGKVLGLLRKVVLYNTQGIDVKTSMFILGKNEVLHRIVSAIK